MQIGFDDILNSIGGSFSPNQMSIFLNMRSDEIDEKHHIYFHEMFHHWQFLLTPYGQLRWGCIRSASSEVIEAWRNATNAIECQRFLPVGNLLKQCDKNSIEHILAILAQDYALTLLNYHECYYESKNVNNALLVTKELICPLISILGQKYFLNGIDIIESFAKFQEAVYCKIEDDVPFYKTIDISRLDAKYYSAYAYFNEQMGPDRVAEFPIICEMALSSNKICKFDNNDLSWRDNHPAWRFVKIIDIVKEKQDSLPAINKDIEANYLMYWNEVTNLCGFQDYNSMWDSAIEYARNSELFMAKNMIKAIDIKLKYPWVLSFPFLDIQVFVSSGIKDLPPYYLLFNDTCEYFVEDESKISEIVFESHYQAFFNQILGNMSRRCIYPDLLQCGFSYYGLSGCKYLKERACMGHFDQGSRIEELRFDESGNVIQGCLFECFLRAADINPDSISFSRISDSANLQDLKKRIQELNIGQMP